ncbi:cell division protein FtsQ [Pelagibacterales bacterium SAG-MED47]|nr:cell division protein FtsQ [Pelagibacterales bacterium SAG-MED47]
MPLAKNKKILAYFFLLLLFGTINNKNIQIFEIFKIKKIEVVGLTEKENAEISKSFEVLKVYNLFFLNRIHLDELMEKYNHIEQYYIFKEYPSSLNVKLKRTKFLAYMSKDNKNFYVGNNRKLIIAKAEVKNLPVIYGDLKINEFFRLKKIIDKSNFKFYEIKNLFLFPSGRWDIETNSGILIKLPKLEIVKSLNLYKDLLKKKKLENMRIIDFRQFNQVIING